MQLIESTDCVEIANLPILIYGGPGLGKTTLAQTAADPLTLDFDKGIHRARNRRAALRFDGYVETAKEAGPRGDFRYPAGHRQAGAVIPYQTLVIDTGGRFLDSIVPVVLADSAKNGYSGNLSPQGWGKLGGIFQQWLKQVLSWGKDVVIVCHEDERSNAADQSYFKPDLPGKMAWKEIHRSFEVVGRLYYEGRRKVLDFSPSDNQTAKDAGLIGKVEVPDVHEEADFLAKIIATCKANIGKTAAASAAVAQAVEEWSAFLGASPDLGAVNEEITGLGTLSPPAKRQAWALVSRHAERRGWTFDKAAKRFVAPEAPTPPPEEAEEPHEEGVTP